MKTGRDGSVQIEESTEGGMAKKKRLSAVRQVLKPPAHPALPSLLKSPPPPLPPPPWPRGGVDMGAGWGGDEKKTQHTRMEAELLT